MNTLGDLLAAARGSTGGFQAWLHRFEPELAIQVEQAAGQTRLSPTGYVRAAIADFSRLASEEDWATLMSSLRDSEDPGMVCLRAMVDWRLFVRGCDTHSHRAAAD